MAKLDSSSWNGQIVRQAVGLTGGIIVALIFYFATHLTLANGLYNSFLPDYENVPYSVEVGCAISWSLDNTMASYVDAPEPTTSFAAAIDRSRELSETVTTVTTRRYWCSRVKLDISD